MYGSYKQWSLSITLKRSYYENKSKGIETIKGSEGQRVY